MNTMTWTNDVSFARAAELRDYLLASAHSGKDNSLSLQGMSRLDVAGLQVLLSARRWLETCGRRMVLENGTEADRVNKLCMTLGIIPFELEKPHHAQ